MAYKLKEGRQVYGYLTRSEAELLDRRAKVERLSRGQLISRILIAYLADSKAETERLEKLAGIAS